MAFKEAVLIMAALFVLLYSLYLMNQWTIIIGICLCLIAGFSMYKIFEKDWDKHFGLDRENAP